MKESNCINWFEYNELFDLAIKKPEFAQLYVTNNCVQSCTFCFNWCNIKTGFIDLDLADWKYIITQLVKIWVTGVNLSGWEVFLYKDLNELISFIKDIWIKRIIINTTWLIDITKYKFQYFDEVVFSIHWTKDIHDKITGRIWNYERLMETLEKFKKAKKAETIIWINCIITEENIDHIDTIYHNHQKLATDYIAFNLEIDKQKIQDTDKKRHQTIDSYFKFLRTIPTDKIKFRHGMKHLIGKGIDNYEEKVPLPDCAAGKFKLIVNYKWSVYPCVYFQNSEFYCWNILKDDIHKIWTDGAWFKKFRELIYKWPDRGCSDCIKKHKCYSWCLAWRLLNDKKTHEKDIRCEIGASFIGNRDNVSL